MASNIFRRIEKKYIINKEQYEEIKKLILIYMKEDSYGKSTICNIYFDSDDYALIRNSITRPYYKDKVRLRSYNVPRIDSKVYLEIKKKYAHVVGKRRIEMSLAEAYDYMEDKNLVDNSKKQIKEEIDYYFDFYHLQPKMYISYEREAYYEIGNNDFRATFDTNILARDTDLDLAKGSYGTDILGKNLYILEIKTLGVIPMWFAEILSKFKLQPGHYSKYGVAYENLVMGKALKKPQELLSKYTVYEDKIDYKLEKNIYALA